MDNTEYKIIQGLGELLMDLCEFEVHSSIESETIRHHLFEYANERYPIVRQPTLGGDTQKLDVYSAVADELSISLAECDRRAYADPEENKRFVRLGGVLDADDVLDENDVLDADDVTDTDVLADRQGEHDRRGVGTVRSIRADTADVVTKIESTDDDSCPNCGVSIPGGGPPFCPQCGRPR
nr:DUF790 family protein [Halostagnicola sp. A56]